MQTLLSNGMNGTLRILSSVMISIVILIGVCVNARSDDAITQAKRLGVELHGQLGGHITARFYKLRLDADELELAFTALSKISNLKSLQLESVDVGESPMRGIATLKSIEFVSISDTSLSAAACGNLAKLRLRHLILDNCGLTPAHLDEVGAMFTLISLDLSNNPQLKSGDYRVLWKLDSLRELALMNLPITDADAAHLLAIPTLEDLAIPGTQVTNELFNLIDDSTKLGLINVQRTKITEAAADQFMSENPKVQVVFPDQTVN